MQDLGKIPVPFRPQAILEYWQGRKDTGMKHESCRCRSNLWGLTLVKDARQTKMDALRQCKAPPRCAVGEDTNATENPSAPSMSRIRIMSWRGVSANRGAMIHRPISIQLT